jgi:hypothetical protein
MDTNRRPRDTSGAIRGGALVFAATVWLAMTVLRETPRFWRDEGKYPVGLRIFVLDFYPLLTAILVLFAFWRAYSLFRKGRPSPTRMFLTLVFWALLATGIGLRIANNVINYMEDRPLHAHPASR